MSNNRNNDLDTAAGCGLLMFGGIAFLGYWIWEQFQTPSKTLLVNLNTSASWGIIIPSIDCEYCGTSQDGFHKECVQCGTVLPNSLSKTEASPAKPSALSNVVSIILIIVSVVVVLWLLAVM